MTGYQSKKAAAQTIDKVNWADHEPDGLSHLPQEPVAWVPISERLPSHNATVMVWRSGVIKRLIPGQVQITTCRLTDNGAKWDADQHNWSLPVWIVRRVTHWMPLPEPPPHA